MREQQLNKLSIIVPCHNEGENVRTLATRIDSVLKKSGFSYELIFVDDSKDNTPLLIADLCHKNPSIKLVRLTRSFGQSQAIFAGLSLSSGDAAVVMDCDLEDPPEAIPKLIEKWNEGFDIVAVRRERVGTKLSYRILAKIFYRISRLLSEVKIPEGVGEFRLLDKRVVEVLKLFPERTRFFRGITLWPGFPVALIDIKRDQRTSGTSNYNFLRAFSVALDGIVSFSHLPLRFIAIIGFVISLVTGGLTVFYLIYRLLYPDIFGPGWASLWLTILFSISFNMVSIGVVAEYVGRILQQVQGRPTYLVDYKIGL